MPLSTFPNGANLIPSSRALSPRLMNNGGGTRVRLRCGGEYQRAARIGLFDRVVRYLMSHFLLRRRIGGQTELDDESGNHAEESGTVKILVFH